MKLLVLACLHSAVAVAAPRAALTDPLEYVYVDTKIDEVTRLDEIDVPANSTLDVNILLDGFATNAPVTVSVQGGAGLGRARGEWFRLLAVPCARNSGRGGFLEMEPGTNPHVARRAPMAVCDILKPIAEANAGGCALTFSGETTPLRWKVRFDERIEGPVLREILRFTVRQGDMMAELPLLVRIHRVRLPPVGRESFKYTNWMNFHQIAVRHNLKEWSEEHWAMIGKYVKMAVGARQNMSWFPGIMWLDAAHEDRFARLLGIYDRAGIWYLESPHLAGFNGPWGSPDFKVAGTTNVTTTTEGEARLTALAKRTQTLVEKYGLKDRWYQHVADEPNARNAGEYIKTAEIVRRAMPGVRLTDAVGGPEFNATIDVPCPTVNQFEFNRIRFAEARSVWTYVCCSPGGKWMNRFMDQQLVKPALLPWVSVLFGVDGFLHWGYNQWQPGQDPFREPYPKKWPGANGGQSLPPGDTHVVYPGTDGPWASARLEATRNGMEDADLLRMLMRRDRVAATNLIGRLVRGYADYTTDLGRYRTVRRNLLEALVACLEGAPWIGDGRPERDGADWYGEDPAPEFRAEFVLPKGVTDANVHFVCAGFGWFGVNGRACMDTDGLDAVWSVYDKTLYSVMKTTGPLHAGTNRVSVFLGNGFYNLPPLRFWGSKCFRSVLAHGRPCFKLVIEGVKDSLVWRWRETNVIRNSVYLGAEIDATRSEDADWKPAVAVKGPKGKIVEWPQTNPQMVCCDIHRGTAKWLDEGDVQVVDFGVNASGVPEFAFENETRGTKIEILYGERLNPDGTVNVLTQTAGQIKRGNGGPGAPKIAAQRDVYICRGAGDQPSTSRHERFSPPFTWHIFRYAEIRGAKNPVLHPMRRVRSMVSPSPSIFDSPSTSDLNRIHTLCLRTFQANLIGGVQSDCPGRERLGYGGDIVATCEAMCLNFDMREIYLKILRDFADEAEDDGWITETAPYVGIADSVGLAQSGPGRAGPISWALAVPVLMDTLLRHYPEAADRILAFYPVCTRYIGLMVAAHPTGIVPNCIGDHEALERAPNEVTATAHWHEFVRLTALFARRLGRTEDAARFEALGRKIAAAFQSRYVKDGLVANGTQSAQAIGLYLGLVPEDQVPAAHARLVKAIEEKGYAPTTGIFSTRYMLLYLATHGRNDVAREIVLHRGFPGWLHMLDRGATTLWETWKESDGSYSNCHPMFGSVDEWILRFAIF